MTSVSILNPKRQTRQMNMCLQPAGSVKAKLPSEYDELNANHEPYPGPPLRHLSIRKPCRTIDSSFSGVLHPWNITDSPSPRLYSLYTSLFWTLNNEPI